MSEKKTENSKELIIAIRISGMVKVRKEIANTLERLRLRRKYSAVLIKSNRNALGMLEKVKHYISYGIIDKGTLVELIKQRAVVDKSKEENKKIKIEPEKNADGLLKGKKLSDFGLKAFFRLHPPRGGIKSKLPSPKGVLGKNKKINELVRRML
ncbi:50S ribosomal protein L30 [Candidatus Pacearchaeota archaeon]|nr:50S ribosomal protein L30 [Candidatus Pacearchaeota archaeon]MBD3282788.1 50S ribosomal protein L30 [Candidatus Pacearchaeota archaeon]